MRIWQACFVCILLQACFSSLAAGATTAEPADSPTVRTLAGSGDAGITDGPGTSASFIAPAGIAYGSDGRLYVADRDAQRIRIVSKAGDVSTLAGSAPLILLGIGAGGGYRDGPAQQALFDMPEAVLPLPDGSVLVADTYNRCLRSIRGGVVTTFAGTREAGAADGPRLQARFSRPMAFARDGAGNIYVADPPNGVRRIDSKGLVTTLSFPDSKAIVALAWTPDAPRTLLVASVAKVERLNLDTSALDRVFPLELRFTAQPAPPGRFVLREGSTNAGPLAALAAFDSNDFIFADALDSAIRVGQVEDAGNVTLDYTRSLTAIPPENASDGIAGFADGPGDRALVDEPVGIAVAPDGSVAVADTGNRRIRLLSTYSHRTHITTDAAQTELPAKPDPREFRIALLGSSYVWWDQSWHDSIAGRVEDRLAAGDHGSRAPRVFPIMRLGVDTNGALSVIDSELAGGVVDMVVLDYSTYGQMGGDGFAGVAFPSGWQGPVMDRLMKTYAELRAAHVGFLVLNMPGASDFPDEYAYFRIPKGSPGEGGETGLQDDPATVQSFHDSIAGVLERSNVPTLDLWPAFLTAYTAPNRIPLYNVWDHHLSRFGRSVVADALAKRILELKPWNATRSASDQSSSVRGVARRASSPRPSD